MDTCKLCNGCKDEIVDEFQRSLKIQCVGNCLGCKILCIDRKSNQMGPEKKQEMLQELQVKPLQLTVSEGNYGTDSGYRSKRIGLAPGKGMKA